MPWLAWPGQAWPARLAMAKDKKGQRPGHWPKTNKDSSMTSNDELLYYMLGQVNQERDWDLPQARPGLFFFSHISNAHV
jgi:hypothetical protein